MTDALDEELARLGYDAKWLEYGFLDRDTLREQLRVFATGDDPNPEHYRYASFRRVLAARTVLTTEELSCYLDLAKCDADSMMATGALADLFR